MRSWRWDLVGQVWVLVSASVLVAGCSLLSLDELGAGGTLATRGGSGGAEATGGRPSEATGGRPSEATGGEPSTGIPCELCALGDNLVHRYSFNGDDATATDSVGTAHGTILNATLKGSGSLVLEGGGSDQYVELPGGIVSVLSSATFEAWLEWHGGEGWQRLFDFGDQNYVAAENAMVGKTFLFLSPGGASEGSSVMQMQGGYRVGGSTIFVADPPALPEGELVHVAVTVDAETGLVHLHRDGARRSSASLPGALSDINDTNVWLGRSQFTHDPLFSGVISEFRIYNTALTEAQLKTTFEAGPDASLSEN